jgi:hypothetical protein
VAWWILLPFDYWLIDPIMKGIQWPFKKLFLFFEPTAVFETDTYGMLWLSVFSIALGLIMHAFVTRIFRNLTISKAHFQQVSSWILAFFLLKYGWDKIVLLQFYKPAPNILYTNFGYLSQDIAFWSLIGSNPGLSRFIGGTELIVGILMLLPRFRFLGATLSAGIFAIIVGINFSFDISVKQLSFSLLFWSSALVLSYPEKWKLLLGFSSQIDLPNHAKSNYKLAIPVLLIIGIESFSSTLQTGNFNFQNDQPIVNTKAYVIVDHPKYTAVFTHPQGFLILEDKAREKRDFPIEHPFRKNVDTLSCSIGSLILSKHLFIQDKQVYPLKTLPINELPVLKNEMHLFSDQFH